jgi:metallophosphoesterase (TIGR00282 family)
MTKILFIGDVVGKPGRRILSQVLPMWKEKYKPDAVIVNVENLAHGKGVTLNTLAEVDSLGIDCFTGGNHIFDKEDQIKECFENYPKLIRPYNIEGSHPGYGYYRFSKSDQQYLVINIHGTIFCDKYFDGQLTNPFTAVDELIKQESQKGDIIFVDFHAEATSEKKTMGYYLDGRVTAIAGTHTHVPTSDAHVMPKGSGFITDVGMTGTRDSALGTKFENALKKFLDPSAKFVNEIEEAGILQINGILVELDSNTKAVKIEKLYQEIN